MTPQWVLFWLVYYVTLSIGIALAYFVASVSPNLDVANALVPIYVGEAMRWGTPETGFSLCKGQRL